jgi:hypothetical protein
LWGGLGVQRFEHDVSLVLIYDRFADGRSLSAHGLIIT